MGKSKKRKTGGNGPSSSDSISQAADVNGLSHSGEDHTGLLDEKPNTMIPIYMYIYGIIALVMSPRTNQKIDNCFYTYKISPTAS